MSSNSQPHYILHTQQFTVNWHTSYVGQSCAHIVCGSYLKEDRFRIDKRSFYRELIGIGFSWWESWVPAFFLIEGHYAEGCKRFRIRKRRY